MLGFGERGGGYSIELKLFQSSRHERQRVALEPLSEAIRHTRQGYQAETYIFEITSQLYTFVLSKILSDAEIDT